MADLNLADTIEALVNQKEAEVINIRRDIHMHPEVSGKEERTSSIVAEYLEKHGIEVQRCKNSFGVIGRLKGSKPGPVIALRADMDALPIQEKTGLPYASKIDGQMHACGHDVHTAVLMGTASVLSTVRDRKQLNVTTSGVGI